MSESILREDVTEEEYMQAIADILGDMYEGVQALGEEIEVSMHMDLPPHSVQGKESDCE